MNCIIISYYTTICNIKEKQSNAFAGLALIILQMKYLFQIANYFNEIDFDSYVKIKVIFFHMYQSMPLKAKYVSSYIRLIDYLISFTYEIKKVEFYVLFNVGIRNLNEVICTI